MRDKFNLGAQLLIERLSQLKREKKEVFLKSKGKLIVTETKTQWDALPKIVLLSLDTFVGKGGQQKKKKIDKRCEMSASAYTTRSRSLEKKKKVPQRAATTYPDTLAFYTHSTINNNTEKRGLCVLVRLRVEASTQMKWWWNHRLKSRKQ
jgi:hypothetical protein